MSILINFLLTIHVIVCLLLVLVVLMQRPKSEGLGAAFGGGFTENIFGAGTTDVLQKFTTWMAGAFFLLTVVLIFLYAHQDRVGTTSTQQNLLKSAAPAPALATPAPTAASTPAATTAAPVAPATTTTTTDAQPQPTASSTATVAPTPAVSSEAATPTPPAEVTPAPPNDPSSPAPVATPTPAPATSPR